MVIYGVMQASVSHHGVIDWTGGMHSVSFHGQVFIFPRYTCLSFMCLVWIVVQCLFLLAPLFQVLDQSSSSAGAAVAASAATAATGGGAKPRLPSLGLKAAAAAAAALALTGGAAAAAVWAYKKKSGQGDEQEEVVEVAEEVKAEEEEAVVEVVEVTNQSWCDLVEEEEAAEVRKCVLRCNK